MLSKSHEADSIPTTESSSDLSEGELALLEMDADFIDTSDTLKAEKVVEAERNRLIRAFGTESNEIAFHESHN